MKRFIAIFLITAHIFSTTGFMISVHTCGNKCSYSINGVTLNQACTCNHDHTDHEDSCCSDKKLLIKSDDTDKSIVKQVSTNFPDFFDGRDHFPLIYASCVRLMTGKGFAFRPDYPPDHSPPLYKLYGVFLI